MTFVQLIGTYRMFGADVLLLACGVTAATSLLKKTVLKSCNKVVFAFLPFVLGTVLYALYRTVSERSLAPISGDFLVTLEGGFGCGCAATLFCAVLKQSADEAKAISPLLPLLEFIPEGRRKQAADALYEATAAMTESESCSYFTESLNDYADPPLTEEQLRNTAAVLAHYVAVLKRR